MPVLFLTPWSLHFHTSWLQRQTSDKPNDGEHVASSLHGFASISRRHTSCKPMIAAVNGSAYGGGVEMILNCDIVIASEDAVFALPEVKRGVLAAQGGECIHQRPFHFSRLPRLFWITPSARKSMYRTR
jgi:enoyl-CoA hydratase/carnithine racemase